MKHTNGGMKAYFPKWRRKWRLHHSKMKYLQLGQKGSSESARGTPTYSRKQAGRTQTSHNNKNCDSERIDAIRVLAQKCQLGQKTEARENQEGVWRLTEAAHPTLHFQIFTGCRRVLKNFLMKQKKGTGLHLFFPLFLNADYASGMNQRHERETSYITNNWPQTTHP